MTPSAPVITYSIVTGMGTLATLGVFIASSVYDIQTIKRFKPLVKQPNANRFRRRPLVSVLMTMNGAAQPVIDSLFALKNGSYHKYEAIVIVNGCTSEQLTVLKNHTKTMKNVRLIQKRLTVTNDVALKTAQKAAKGELLATLRPGFCLQATSLKDTVSYFLVDESVEGVAGSVHRALQSRSVSSHMTQIAQGLSARVHKAGAVHGGRRILRQAPMIVYRRELFAKRAAVKLLYAPHASGSFGTMSFRRRQTVQRRMKAWLGWAMLAFAQAYLWYLALVVQVVQPLEIIWLASCGLGLLVILSNEHMRLTQKLRSLMLMPFWYVASFGYAVLRVMRPLTVITRLRIRLSIAP